MTQNAKILFVVPPADQETREFVQALKEALHDWNITITESKITTLLFEARRYDLVHFFFLPDAKSSQFLNKLSGGSTLQTILGRPKETGHQKKTAFSQNVVVFSQFTKEAIERTTPGLSVTVVPPCVQLPDATQLTPTSHVRELFQVGERMMVVALNDMRNQKEFDAFLYIAREYNRREVFRFLIPVYEKDKSAESWREKLQYSIDMEKLESTTILRGDDLHSLIDAADVGLYVSRSPEEGLEFPARVLEALLRGKPVLSFAESPVSDVIREFNKKWVTNNTEDFVRESRDLKKDEAKLEEISTELARFARSRFEPSSVAAAYKDIYNRLLSKTTVRQK